MSENTCFYAQAGGNKRRMEAGGNKVGTYFMYVRKHLFLCAGGRKQTTYAGGRTYIKYVPTERTTIESRIGAETRRLLPRRLIPFHLFTL